MKIYHDICIWQEIVSLSKGRTVSCDGMLCFSTTVKIILRFFCFCFLDVPQRDLLKITYKISPFMFCTSYPAREVYPRWGMLWTQCQTITGDNHTHTHTFPHFGSGKETGVPGRNSQSMWFNMQKPHKQGGDKN